MNLLFKDIRTQGEIEDAAKILLETFAGINISAWPDIGSARKEVRECLIEPNITLGAFDGDCLAGWIGLRPLYEKTWELHPIVVATRRQNQGIGRKLIDELEKRAVGRGIHGILLGTDDETGSTSLSEVDLDGNNVFHEIETIRSVKRHPYEFYKKCGYAIIGVVPDANGERKPDIWMWKKIGRDFSHEINLSSIDEKPL